MTVLIDNDHGHQSILLSSNLRLINIQTMKYEQRVCDLNHNTTDRKQVVFKSSSTHLRLRALHPL